MTKSGTVSWSGEWTSTGGTNDGYSIYKYGSSGYYLYHISPNWWTISTSIGDYYWDNGYCYLSTESDINLCTANFFEDYGSTWDSDAVFTKSSCGSAFTVNGGCFDNDIDALCVSTGGDTYQFEKIADDDDCTYHYILYDNYTSEILETYYLHHTTYDEWMISLDSISRDTAMFACLEDSLLNCTSDKWIVGYSMTNINETIPYIVSNTDGDVTIEQCGSTTNEVDEEHEEIMDIVIIVAVVFAFTIIVCGFYLLHKKRKPQKEVAFDHPDGDDTQKGDEDQEQEEEDENNETIEVEVPIQTAI